MSGLSLLHERLDQHLELSASIGQVFDDKSKSIKKCVVDAEYLVENQKVLLPENRCGEVRGSIKDGDAGKNVE